MPSSDDYYSITPQTYSGCQKKSCAHLMISTALCFSETFICIAVCWLKAYTFALNKRKESYLTKSHKPLKTVGFTITFKSPSEKATTKSIYFDVLWGLIRLSRVNKWQGKNPIKCFKKLLVGLIESELHVCAFGDLPVFNRIQLVWTEGFLAANQDRKSDQIMSF